MCPEAYGPMIDWLIDVGLELSPSFYQNYVQYVLDGFQMIIKNTV